MIGTLHLAELLFQLLILLVGYALGAAAVLLGARLVGIGVAMSHAALLVLALPLVSTLLAEGFTSLWGRTPGSLGLGGLTAFMPLFVAAALISVAVTVAQQVMAPFDPHLPRSSASLTSWLGLAVACSILALGLWRYWPEPRARLW